LEVAAGWSPKTINQFIGEKQPDELPPLVSPASCVAWYPTRYNAKELFGSSCEECNEISKTAIMAIFAEEDNISGARKSDAKILKSYLDNVSWVTDNMVKVFENEDHGFAHVGIANRKGDEFGNGEVVSLLSTAWIDTYSRVYLPTAGPKVKSEDSKWNSVS